jgi:hypothetical protein
MLDKKAGRLKKRRLRKEKEKLEGGGNLSDSCISERLSDDS